MHSIAAEEAPTALLGLQWMFAILSILLAGMIVLTALLSWLHRRHRRKEVMPALERLTAPASPPPLRRDVIETLRAITVGDLAVEPDLLDRVGDLRRIVDHTP